MATAYGWPLPLGLGAAVLAAALVAGVASTVLMPLRGVSFALATLGPLGILLAEGALLLAAALVFPGGLVRVWSGGARRLPYNRPTHASDH